ncbi:MAG: toxin-antitoxin system HicB family antitoxin [Candidatus Bipolaricaulia bacterium]
MRRKPNRDSEGQTRAAEEFIGGVEKTSDETETVYPWEEERVREDVTQSYPLRLPEPLHLKLKFLAEKTGKSMNELCNEAVRDLVEDRLGEMLAEDR